MSDTPPLRCLLCNARNGIVPARFHQLYSQKDSAPVSLHWWECRTCRGWFVHPVPAPEMIERHWEIADYQNPMLASQIARAKEVIQQRILSGLSRWTEPGPLLDFGCNFGEFLVMARKAGWTPSGFEPYSMAAQTARANGFDVRCGWSLQEAGFPEGYFAAITANDVFCLVWDPITTLQMFQRLLKPGGVLAMRLTNKRFILGLLRAFSPPGPSRDARMSRFLQSQFHGIGLVSLTRIVQRVGFNRIRIQSRATTAPWGASSWETRIAYLGADLLYLLSLGKINLSPGVLLFARKAIS